MRSRRSRGWISNAASLAETANAKERLLASSEWNRRSHLYLVTSSPEEVGVFSNVSSEFNSAGHASARSMQLFDIRYFPFSLARIHVEWSWPLRFRRIRVVVRRVNSLEDIWRRQGLGARSLRFSHRPFKLARWLFVPTPPLILLPRKENIYVCSAFP